MLKVTFLLLNILTTDGYCQIGPPCKRNACLAPLMFPGPKIGIDNFRIGGANLQLGSGDGGVCLWTLFRLAGLPGEP